MRRWIILVPIVAAGFFLLKKEHVELRAPAAMTPLVLAPAPAAKIIAPRGRVPAMVLRDPRKPSSIQLPSQSVVKVQRPPVEQAGHLWHWLEGAVAVSANDPRIKDVPRLSERPGFVVISKNLLPEGVAGLPLVERQDNGLVGIFTGVLKAMGKAKLLNDGQFRSDCPCEIEEAYPALKSFLLRSPAGSQHEELKTCLQSTGLFKKLEWEILDHSQRSR